MHEAGCGGSTFSVRIVFHWEISLLIKWNFLTKVSRGGEVFAVLPKPRCFVCFVLHPELQYKILKMKTFNPKPGIFLFRNAFFWNSSTTGLELSVTASCYFSTGLYSVAAAARVSSCPPPRWPLAGCQAAFLDSPQTGCFPATGVC